jgi:hypothetical protein
MISRREMIAATAAALVIPIPSLRLGPGIAHFLTPAEFALLDDLSDMIMPTDDHSPGARAAGVASYIDARLAESLDHDRQVKFRAGLAAVESLSREMNGTLFLKATPEQRARVLTRMAAGEADPKTEIDRFFKDLKWQTVYAYYTSKIGIHDDQHYKGNVYQTGEYAGFDAT